MPLVENKGSNARDFCMLERNLLATLKLACLLCLLFASILLRGRFSSEDESSDHQSTNAEISIASLHFVSSVVVIGGAVFEYYSGVRDLRGSRALMRSEKPRLGLMAGVSSIIVATCLVLLANPDLL